MTDQWMYFNYETGRMLALGTKSQILDIATKDFEYLCEMKRLMYEKQESLMASLSGGY